MAVLLACLEGECHRLPWFKRPEPVMETAEKCAQQPPGLTAESMTSPPILVVPRADATASSHGASMALLKEPFPSDR